MQNMTDTTNNYINFIEKVISRYYPLKEETFLKLVSISKLQKIKKGEVFLNIGEKAQHVHILHKGSMIAYFLDEEGNTYNKNIFLEGDFVGSTVSYLTNSESEFALEAIEDCELISFKYDDYRNLIETHQDMKDFYISYLEKNWVIAKEKREIALVMEDATSRYLKLLEKHPEINKRIPLHHIASHLGISPTQLSRIRKNLK